MIVQNGAPCNTIKVWNRISSYAISVCMEHRLQLTKKRLVSN